MTTTDIFSSSLPDLRRQKNSIIIIIIILNPSGSMAESISSQLSIDHKEIRLLFISPSTIRLSKICCKLHKVSLNDNPVHAYKALSYVWGKDKNRQVIELDGRNIEVTPNLHNALIQIRDGIEVRVFWIDAVCINQDNLIEKGHQVRLMGDIYRLAEEVWCWLGLAQYNDDKIIAGLDIAKILTLPQELEGLRPVIYGFIRESLSGRATEALISFCEAPYWKRTWTIQEIALAQKITILWGDSRFPSDILVFLQGFAITISTAPFDSIPNYERLELIGDNVNHVTRTRNRVQQGFKGFSIDRSLEFLYSQSHLEVTDARDKICGFLGLLDNINLSVPIIDYYKQSVGEVYTDFARRQIEASKSLQVIRFAGFGRSNNKRFNLPSWVPDWHCPFNAENDTIGFGVSMKSYLYRASKERPASTSFEDNELSVEGIECDSVSVFCKKMLPPAVEELLFRDKPFTYPTGISRLQALFRVLLMDNYFLSPHRLDDDPELWGSRLAIGFFVQLGRDAIDKIDGNDQSSCGLDEIEAILQSPPHIERDSDSIGLVVSGAEMGIDARTHLFIRALRNWYHGCILIIDNILKGSGGQNVDEDGGIQNDMMVSRIRDIWLLSMRIQPFYETFDLDEKSTSVQPANLEHRLESLQSWKDCIETALRGETFAAILEPFLHEAGGRSIEWPDDIPTIHESLYFSRFQKCMQRCITDTVLFETKDGYLGLGPKMMRKGDLICVLLGSKVPFIMRKVDNHFILLGECFVLGLMDGEAIDWLEAERVKLQEFQIR
jgi:hypothetical protein